MQALASDVKGAADERTSYGAAFVESAGYFLPPGSPLAVDPVVLDGTCDTINAIYGSSLGRDDALKIGEHIVRLERDFNQKAAGAAA